MAYNIININPLDLQPSKGVGIKVPFDGPTGLNVTYTSASPDQNLIQIYFSYSIRNTNMQDEITINFNN